MKILIANPGSTSYKCKLFDMCGEKVLFQAGVERIGDEKGLISYTWNKKKFNEERPVPDMHEAVKRVLDAMDQVAPVSEIAAVGFKTVLAKSVTGCVLLTDDVLEAMKAYLPLAPVHTQVYLTAISVIKALMPEKPLYGLFETAFHQHIPPEACLYGIPYELSEKYGIRKYGFHGASHRYIAERVQTHFAQSDAVRVISCHLGGSASVCAIQNGQSLDTSMGMSPQCGLLNAKRVGDMDAFALLYLMEEESLTIAQARELLASKGGLYGISGISGDLRDIEAAMAAGNRRAEAAFNAFAYGVKRYIGEYMAVLNGADFIAFTGGLGQHSPDMRSRILEGLENLGIIPDQKLNEANPLEGVISAEGSSVKIVIIPTNEELIVSREVVKAVKDGR
jgi:acetate kinase